jgi:very-short-patch-repair endonuclease
MAYLGLTSKPVHLFGADNNTIHKARDLRKRMTPAERILWSCLRKNQVQGCRFRRQHPLGYYIADFYCVEIKLVIEIDGTSHNGKEEYDEQREKTIKDYGLVIIRFTNEQVFTELNFVINTIRSKANEIRFLNRK